MKDINKTPVRQYRVHKILAHSYTMYFILFLVGVFLDIFFSARGEFASGGEFFASPIMIVFSILLLIIATLLILWAQKTSRNLDIKDLSKETFCKGPYCYTRSPTHWGLFFLILGFGIIANAFFVILFTLISFLIAKFVFLNKQEAVLAEKYGTHYLEYKKMVKF